jgi:hypothetical protein
MIDDIVDRYVKLLIIQYSSIPKAVATIRTITEEFLSNGIMFDVRDGFNFDTAVGKQQDIIAKYLDIDRFFKGQAVVPGAFFSYTDYEDPNPDSDPNALGYTTYADFNTSIGGMLTYSQVISTTNALSDSDFLLLMQLRRIQNTIDHSHKAIDDAIFGLFGQEIHAEPLANMAMLYVVSQQYELFARVALSKDAFPKPMGVGLNFIVVEEPDAGSFGYTSYDEDQSIVPSNAIGYSTYATWDTDVGGMLTYDKILT